MMVNTSKFPKSVPMLLSRVLRNCVGAITLMSVLGACGSGEVGEEGNVEVSTSQAKDTKSPEAQQTKSPPVDNPMARRNCAQEVSGGTLGAEDLGNNAELWPEYAEAYRACMKRYNAY